MRHLPRFMERLKTLVARGAVARARRHRDRRPRAALRWLRLAARLSPAYELAHRDLVQQCREMGDLLGALTAAQLAADRFPELPEVWVLLGACYRAVYRTHDALVAYEHALAIEEHPGAAMAAGELYRQIGDLQTAGARFARAYAAGAGPDALRENAKALRAAGDASAAEEAVAMWERETGKVWEN